MEKMNLGKTLSYLLRHGEQDGVELMPGGYIYLSMLRELPPLRHFSEKDILSVVSDDEKGRFEVKNDEGGLKIRALQGHSVKVAGLEENMQLLKSDCTVKIIHGTTFRAWEEIKIKGLSRMGRQYIHFAQGEPHERGVISGIRSTSEVIIFVNAQEAMKHGLQFFKTLNDVIVSKGNEHGLIMPEFFSDVLRRDTRESLLPLVQLKKKGLILGHSFVRRLRDWMRNNDRVMSPRNMEVHLHGIGGRTVSQIFHCDLDVVRRIRPNVIFLQIGGNDITWDSSPTDIFTKLKRLITVLGEELRDAIIIVGSLFERKRPRKMNSHQYGRKVKKINKFLLKEFGTHDASKNVFVFTHKFFKDELFDGDGVHLNDDGNLGFFHSILSALQLVV